MRRGRSAPPVLPLPLAGWVSIIHRCCPCCEGRACASTGIQRCERWRRSLCERSRKTSWPPILRAKSCSGCGCVCPSRWPSTAEAALTCSKGNPYIHTQYDDDDDGICLTCVSDRHGCLLAASGLLLALGQGGGGAGRAMLLAPGSGEVASAAVSVVLQLEKARLYRGRGGKCYRAFITVHVCMYAHCQLLPYPDLPLSWYGTITCPTATTTCR